MNVTISNVPPLKVILPKQAAPWYQFVVVLAVDLSSYTEKSISLSGTLPLGKKSIWIYAFRWMMYNSLSKMDC
jgi:hypothetical protein